MFYRLNLELSKPGYFAKRERIAPTYQFDAPNAQGRLKNDEFPDFKPSFAELILTKESSRIDFINNAGAIKGRGLIISKKVKNILSGFNLPPYRFYGLDLCHNGKLIKDEYFWIQVLIIENYNWIDFNKSQFRLKSKNDFDEESEGKSIQIRNALDLKELINASSEEYVLFSKIILNEEFKKMFLDLFYLDKIGEIAYLNPIISERLKEEFEKENLRGYKLSELNIFC